MRQRLSILLTGLMLLTALVAAGCGDDEDAGSKPASPTNETSATDSTGKESAVKDAKRARDECREAAEELPDQDAIDQAKRQCQAAYDNIKAASKAVDDARAQTRENCTKAAEAIPSERAREEALAACERVK